MVKPTQLHDISTTLKPDVKSKLWFESKMYYVSCKEGYHVKENSVNQGLDRDWTTTSNK